MKILMIGGSPYSTFITLGVSLLSALTKQEGHEYKYFDLCDYNFDVKDEHVHGEEQLEYRKVKNPERAPQFTKKPRSLLTKDFMDAVETFRPDLIGLSATSGDACFGKLLLKELKKKVDIPVIVGGVYPTVDPEGVIAEPWVDMINIGQGENSFIELLNSYRHEKGFDTSIKNMWFKENGKIIKNPQSPPHKSLDWLPYPDWSIFKEYHFYRPFVGYLYRIGTIEVSRGCPLTCKYCINSYLPKIYEKNALCTKSVERAIKEIEFLKNKYQIDFIRFLDEIFLLKNIGYLREFAKEYCKRIKLPFIISTTASTVTEEKVQLLKEMNCVNVGLGLETGNEDLRINVLNKKVPDSYYEKAYKLINDAGIRTTAQIMFGLPHETEEDYRRAIRLVKKWNVDTAHVAIFYPFKGSVLREYAIQKGFLSLKKIEDFEKDGFITTKYIPTLLEFSEEQINKMEHYRRFFTVYKEVPEWLWHLVDECGKEDDEFSTRLSSMMRMLVAKKRGL